MRRARWGRIRISLFVLLAGLATTVAFLPAATGRAAQKKSEPASTVPEPHTLQTEDGVNLRAKYYRAAGDNESKEAPVIVLLHMKDGNRFVWEPDNGFAALLQSKGFAVITVDLRYHGESKVGGATPAGTANQGKPKGKKDAGMALKVGDYRAMVDLDMEAVKKFIFEEHQTGHLNMNKMGIVGPEMGASIAVAYTVLDWAKDPYDDGQPGFQTPRGQDVRAIVLISPEETYHGSGIKLAQLMPAIKDPDKQIAVLICSGNDPKEEAQAKKIFEMVNPTIVGNKEKERLNADRMFQKSFPARLTGTNLLDKQLDVENLMLGFFTKHLKSVNSIWRDRESKRKKVKK